MLIGIEEHFDSDINILTWFNLKRIMLISYGNESVEACCGYKRSYILISKECFHMPSAAGLAILDYT